MEPALPATAWVRGGVRPANAPARRVAAAGHLCARLAETGPVEFCLELRERIGSATSTPTDGQCVRATGVLLTLLGHSL